MPEQKKAVTPRLRFPEFRNAGPWEVKRLGDVVSITGGGTPSRSRKDFWNGNIPWVSSSDVSDESIHELKITKWITSEAVSSSATKIVPENSILLVSRVGVGKVAISRIPVCTSQDFTNLTPLRDDFIFLGYYLSAWANVLKSFGQGMAIQGFKKQDIENLAIPLPDANSGEQQKIADCLSSLDELIELEAKKLEALKAHKKGLMQQLFPREGETTPRLRFPEFRDAGPWEVKQLRELLDYERPDKYIVESDNYEPQGIPVLTANKGFILGYTSEQNGIYEDLPAIIFDDFTTDKKFVDFPFKVKSSAIKILKPKGKNNIRFVFELMNLIQFDPGQHKRYYISEYQHISVLVPNTAEQQKIADCLSSLDELIQLEAQKLEALKAHKKGLMQQLFPKGD